MSIDLKAEEGNSSEHFHFEKQTKMLYKMVQHLTHTFDLPDMDFMRLKQGVVIEGIL